MKQADEMKAKWPKEKACGAVLFSQNKGELNYLLIEDQHGTFGFPKGHVEANETEIETALREIKEEVDLHPRLLANFRKSEHYVLPEKNNAEKENIYFLGEFDQKQIKIQEEEVRHALILPYEECLNYLQFESKKQLLQEAHQFLTKHLGQLQYLDELDK